jgi:P27 family predicted phage terminase small subunit
VPPARKSADRRQNRVTTDLEVLTGGALAIPDPPAGLLKARKEEWAAYFSSPVASAVDARSDIGALTRLFELKAKVDRFEKAAKGKPLVAGSTGQPILNPLLKEAHSLLGEIRQLEDRFGMTPSSRARLGVVIGESVKTLDDLNRRVDESVDNDDDPRLQVIDVTASDSG